MSWLLSLGALGVTLLGGFVALDRLAVASLTPRHRAPTRHPRDMAGAEAHEDVAFPSAGIELRGWLLSPPVDGSERAAVAVVHGWGADSGDMLQVAEPLVRAGHPVLVFDVRHHGRSPGASFLTARQFRDDVLAATRFLARRYPGRARVLVGHSLGGAAAVLAALEGAPVHAVAHVAAPADILEVLEIRFRRGRLPAALVVRLLAPFWERRAGVPFEELQPFLRAPELRLPLLVVGAKRDRYVPTTHVERMAVAPRAELRVIDAGHFDLLGHPEFAEALADFVARVEEEVATRR